MERSDRRGRGHYRALGVPADCTQKQIERAFDRWRAARAAGRAVEEEYLAAERSYHALADPAGRRGHDRQLGLLGHPAWRVVDAGAARRLARRGLRDLAVGRADLAARRLEAALGMGERAAEAWAALAGLRSGGCPREAARRAAAAVKRSPRDAALRFALAETLRAAGGAERAVREERRGWALIARETLSAALPRLRSAAPPRCGAVTALTDRRRLRG